MAYLLLFLPPLNLLPGCSCSWVSSWAIQEQASLFERAKKLRPFSHSFPRSRLICCFPTTPPQRDCSTARPPPRQHQGSSTYKLQRATTRKSSIIGKPVPKTPSVTERERGMAFCEMESEFDFGPVGGDDCCEYTAPVLLCQFAVLHG